MLYAWSRLANSSATRCASASASCCSCSAVFPVPLLTMLLTGFTLVISLVTKTPLLSYSVHVKAKPSTPSWIFFVSPAGIYGSSLYSVCRCIGIFLQLGSTLLEAFDGALFEGDGCMVLDGCSKLV